MRTIHFTRDDIIRGNIPQYAAHLAKSNASTIIVVEGEPVRYHATEWCAGCHHPDEKLHPWRSITTEDGQVKPVPREARIRFALADEVVRREQEAGRSEDEALKVACAEVFGDGWELVVEDHAGHA